MTQKTLFQTFDSQRLTKPAKARNVDPDTSHEAAKFMNASGSAKAHCEKILAVVRAQEGLTAVEIGAITSVQVTKRFTDLSAYVKYGPKKRVQGHPTSFQTWWLKTTNIEVIS